MSRTIAISVASFALVASLVAVAFALRLPAGDGRPAAGVEAGPRLVYAEFGATADRIFVASPDDPAQRELVDTVEHAAGWGINPAPAVVDGRTAFTVLPAGATPRRDTPAELWLLDIEARERTRLASDADLLVAPIFDTSGAELIYRRSSSSAQELVRVDLATRVRSVVHAEDTAFGIFPIGFDADRRPLFARLSVAGTDVYRVREDRIELVFHASDNIARDWRLSPGAEVLAYLAPEASRERVVHRALVHDLGDGQPRPALPLSVTGASEQYAPAWTRDGAYLAVGQEGVAGAGSPVAVLATDQSGAAVMLPAGDRGFDVPLGWSPTGAYLAVRHFDGVSSHQPGSERLTVIARDGRRVPISDGVELIYIGWIGRA